MLCLCLVCTSLFQCKLVMPLLFVKVKKGNMQQQFAEMAAQLNALQVEHNKLTSRNTVLEKVLHSRQNQLQILQDERKVLVFAVVPSLHGACLLVQANKCSARSCLPSGLTRAVC